MKKILVLIVVVCWATTVRAQDTSTTTFYFTSAYADILTSLPSPKCHEENPVWMWTEHRPVALAITSGAVTIGNYFLWKWVGKKYPRVANIALLTTGSIRMGGAINNLAVCF